MEVWKMIPGMAGYEASDQGGVRNSVTGRVLSTSVDRYGYLITGVGGKTKRVHRLVMLAFHGESELTVDHLNGDKTDNRLSNLEYVTNKENIRRAAAGQAIDRTRFVGIKRTSNKWGYVYKLSDGSVTVDGFATKEKAADDRDQLDLDVDRQNRLMEGLRKRRALYGIQEKDGKFIVRKVIDGVDMYLGVYKSRKDALDILSLSDEELRGIRDEIKARKSRLPKGVTVNPKGRFVASKRFDGKQYNVGTFDTVEEAQLAWESADLKFCLDKIAAQKAKKSSQYKGVSFNKFKKKWDAFLPAEKKGGKTRHLGTYATELEAHEARCEAVEQHRP